MIYNKSLSPGPVRIAIEQLDFSGSELVPWDIFSSQTWFSWFRFLGDFCDKYRIFYVQPVFSVPSEIFRSLNNFFWCDQIFSRIWAVLPLFSGRGKNFYFYLIFYSLAKFLRSIQNFVNGASICFFVSSHFPGKIFWWLPWELGIFASIFT